MIKLKEIINDYWGSPEQKYWHPGENPTVDVALIRYRKQKIMLKGRNIPNFFEHYILLIKRQSDTENEQWALPGGFVDTTAPKGQPFVEDKETFIDAAIREVKEETGLYIKQFKNSMRFVKKYSGSGRDPRDNDKAWSATNLYALDLTGVNLSELKVKAGDDASDARWFNVFDDDGINKLNIAFDHRQLIEDAIKKVGFVRK